MRHIATEGDGGDDDNNSDDDDDDDDDENYDEDPYRASSDWGNSFPIGDPNTPPSGGGGGLGPPFTNPTPALNQQWHRSSRKHRLPPRLARQAELNQKPRDALRN